jgi:hypothetical protein
MSRNTEQKEEKERQTKKSLNKIVGLMTIKMRRRGEQSIKDSFIRGVSRHYTKLKGIDFVFNFCLKKKKVILFGGKKKLKKIALS